MFNSDKYQRSSGGRRLAKWLLTAGGLVSLLWFLIRVIPKPSRAAYPCQRIAFPLASGFVIWLLGTLGSVAGFRKAKSLLQKSHYLLAAVFIIAAVACIWIALSFTGQSGALAENPSPNQPIGLAKGLNPGRVVWVHDPNATSWAGPGAGNGYWWQPEHTDQNAVDKMISNAIQWLTGKADDSNAWDALFRHFNQSAGKSGTGYKSGEKIMVKVNLSTCNRRLGSVDPCTYNKLMYLDKVDTSPQMIVGLLRHLVYKVGVRQSDISVGDTVAFFPNHYWNICHAEFPDVCYIDPCGYFGRTPVNSSDIIQHWSHGETTSYETDYISRCFAEANYIINFPCLKGHAAGITLCGKNHYGSYIRLPDDSGYYNLHYTIAGNSYEPNMGHYRALVDIMGHSDMGQKTLLYLIDGLYGGYKWDGTIYKFHMAPFNDDWPSSLFASQDPVAIDSVGLDFLWEEWPHVARVPGVDDYLHEAALANNPPSGTFYDPDGNGIGLDSLGVHEHWNNAADKQYSRNLLPGCGIELISAPPAELTPGDLDHSGKVDMFDLSALADNWLQNVPPQCGGDLNYDSYVNFDDFAVLAGNWQK